MHSKKTVILYVVTICIFLTLFIEVLIYKINYAKTEIETSETFDGEYRLAIYEVGEPAWHFGKSRCIFELKNGNDVIQNYEFRVLNDGKKVQAYNFEIYWQSTYVRVIVNGKEQSDYEFCLYFDGTVRSGAVQENYVFSDDAENYDMDNVMDSYADQKIKSAYEAVYEYLVSEGKLSGQDAALNAKPELSYYYSAKGEIRAIVSKETADSENGVLYTEHELRYNKLADNEYEIVYQVNFWDENGGTAKEPQIMDFFMVNFDTLEVTDTGRTSW